MVIERRVPGTIHVEGREWLYVQERESEHRGDLVTAVLTAVDRQERLARRGRVLRGGVLTEGCRVSSPDGRSFQAFSFKADKELWREDLLDGARNLGLLTAELINGSLCISDGTTAVLDKCTVEFLSSQRAKS